MFSLQPALFPFNLGSTADGRKDERCLIYHLLKDYDSRARPVLDSLRPVNVLFGITPIQISDLVRILILMGLVEFQQIEH